MRWQRLAAGATPVRWAGLATLLLGLAPSVGRADVILGNLGAGDGGNVMINPNNYVAASFTMGSQAYALSDVQVRLTGGVPPEITFQLRGDAGGSPAGGVLVTFNGAGTSEQATNTFTFAAGSPFTLTPNSTYWLVGSTTSSSARWVDSSPPTNPSGIGATFGQYKESSNSGSSWSGSSVKPLFQLDGTPTGVPEPSSLALVGAVACVAAAAGWRRRTRGAGSAAETAPPAGGT